MTNTEAEIMNKKHEQSQKASGGGISFCGLLAIVFITLKLLGKITWPWLWVLSPLWIPLAIFVAIVLIVFIVGLIATLVSS